MRIETLIKRLKEVKAKHGNIQVGIASEDLYGCYDYSINFLQLEGVVRMSLEDSGRNCKVLLLGDPNEDFPGDESEFLK